MCIIVELVTADAEEWHIIEVDVFYILIIKNHSGVGILGVHVLPAISALFTDHIVA